VNEDNTNEDTGKDIWTGGKNIQSVGSKIFRFRCGSD
jgi:hypothetical protein